MATERLAPRLEVLSKDYVLTQAFKKTASHLRSHTWFADTLAIDLAAADFPNFLADVQRRILDPTYRPPPLRIVPAPKSPSEKEKWEITEDGNWQPKTGSKTKAAVRPLAHVELADQVICTAIMLCLADRIETMQGPTSIDVGSALKRQWVVSYGNRLFCDEEDDELVHRWGSSSTYSAYFDDYKTFINRPETVAESISVDEDSGQQVLICHSDLRQFYDRVRPELLWSKLQKIRQDPAEDEFFALAGRILNWQWHSKDRSAVERYQLQSDISGFSAIALPQGLVAAGFFANIALMEFDEAVRQVMGTAICNDFELIDICRYVDDLRLVVRTDLSIRDAKQKILHWLGDTLTQTADGMVVSEEKTVCSSITHEQNPLVAQSRKMERIQRQISGGMDAEQAQSVLDSITGLLSAQRQHSVSSSTGQGWTFNPVPDVRDATVERFAAARFRKTYRSLRPLLASRSSDSEDLPGKALLPVTSQEDLDDQARVFALDLVGSWVADPSNVRQLRIGLDIWPDPDLLTNVLNLLDQLIKPKTKRGNQRLVGFYCISEIYRACATETGYVGDAECLPRGVDIDGFRASVVQHARGILALGSSSSPWYVMQQAMLVCSVHDPVELPFAFSVPELRHYRNLQRVIHRSGFGGTAEQTAVYLSVISQALPARRAPAVVGEKLLRTLAHINPNLVADYCGNDASLSQKLDVRTRIEVGAAPKPLASDEQLTLAQLINNGPEVDELHVIEFAIGFLETLAADRTFAVTPSEVILRLEKSLGDRKHVKVLEILNLAPESASSSLFSPPRWVSSGDLWRYQLGYLLRFMLIKRSDFTVRPNFGASSARYCSATKHWSIRKLGHFNGYEGFADLWAATSDWLEALLCDLLRWPGMRRINQSDATTNETKLALLEVLRLRRAELTDCVSADFGSIVLHRAMHRVVSQSEPSANVLRACVMQTIVPDDEFFLSAFKDGDPQLLDRVRRKQMRNHLSTALRTVAQMLDLRNTHTDFGNQLDLLIFPELAAHPDDIQSILVPFVRYHRTAIVVGSTYEKLKGQAYMVNAALWILPSTSSSGRVKVSVFRQGKKHLSKAEQAAVRDFGLDLRGYRPAQWVIDFHWHKAENPVRLSAAVCYDSTDIALSTVLRNRADIFVVPALNKDVATFDHMATALSYHMFQYVVIANNGAYGGSNAYTPTDDRLKRRVFHLHGQPQASMSLFEIENLRDFLDRRASANYKFPPAGM